VPFAGLYVLSMSIIGPILAVNSERIGGLILRPARTRPAPNPARERMREESIALLDAVTADQGEPEVELDDVDIPLPDRAGTVTGAIATQAAEQSDVIKRKKDPEY